ncbi:hypothetical protein JCM8547_005970 [Rhodosporidiobolus lusitaniae]
MNGATPSSSSSSFSSTKRVVDSALTGGETPPSKKARLTATKVEQDEEEGEEKTEDEVKLELFRKEALYRELLSYKRQLARAQQECETLRAQRAACEVRLGRIEVGWREVVEECGRVLPPVAGEKEGEREASPSLTDPSLSDEALEAALAHRTTSTLTLLTRLSSLPSTSSTPPSTLEEKARTLLASSLESREALRILRESHAAMVLQLEETHARLVKAEKRFDRFQSATVAAVEGRAVPRDVLRAVGAAAASPAPAAGGGGTSPATNGASSALVKQEPPSGPSDPGGQQLPDGGTGGQGAGLLSAEALGELDELRGIVEKRGVEIEQLREERIGLKMEIDMLKGNLVAIPDDIVAETPTFRLMQQHVQYLTGEFDTKRQEAERAVKEAEELREGMEAFREGIFRDATEQATDLQARLSSRESDLSRLRSTRDELKAEAAELRAKETDRAKALDELRTLAQARQGRLAAYASEVRRLRLGKAGEDGKPDEVDARIRLAEAQAAVEEEEGAEEGEVEDDLVADLQSRLKKAEALLLALRDQLHTYADAGQSMPNGVPSAGQLVESESRAREELQRAQGRLERLDRLLGPGGEVEVRQMAERLREKDDEVRKAEAKVKSQEAATNMLYGEIDRLSTAWASLDEQNASKVFNLAALEDKIQRLNADKAKADNRYFATMRQKDALTNENAVLNKLAEKQQQKVEAANEVQRSLSAQLTAAEKEIALHQKNVHAYQEELGRLRRETAELNLRHEQHTKHIAELTASLSERNTQAENEASLRSKADERVAKLERQLQQAQDKASAATAAAAASASASGGGGGADATQVRELKQYNADLSRMVQCSSCRSRLKSVVLQRCGHLFCRECIDLRLQNRSRKCPSCQTQFSSGEVGPAFLV